MEILRFLLEFTPFSLILGFVAVCLAVYILRCRTCTKKFPPGPRGWPIVGYWPHIGNEPHEVFRKLGDIYGNIFMLSIGDNYVTVLNDFQSIKEAFLKKADSFSDRPPNVYNSKFIFGHSGLFIISGDSFKEERRFIMNSLKDFGVGKSSIEGVIYEEVQFAVNRILASEGTPFNPISLFGCIFGNSMMKYLADKHYDYDDPRFLKVLEVSHLYDEIAGRFSALDFMPWLRFLPESLNGLAESRIAKEVFQPFFGELLLEHAKVFNEARIHDFFDSCLKKLSAEERQRLIDNPDEDANFRMIRGHALILFVGGASVGSGVLSILVKMLAVHEEIQETIREEVDRVVGPDRSPSYSDRFNMPYTEATVFESLRYSNIVPIGSFRYCSDDVKILNYDIPKNCVMYGNYGKLLNDPQYWKNPNEFCPENFLDDSGKVYRPECFWPFSAGRRQCPGQNFAEIQMFLILVSIMQHLKLFLPPDASPNIEFINGSIRYPKAFEMIAKKR